MNHLKPSISVNVDITNPGQYFACCGLLELADRLWPGAEGWFDENDEHFHLKAEGSLAELIQSISTAELTPIRKADPYSTPIRLGAPFRPLGIDWWETDLTGARDLKVWAGTMESFGIAHAMQHALKEPRFWAALLFHEGMVVTVPGAPKKKKEPYYFDSRRAPNAHSRDVGFSVNDISISSVAHPAVELLCLVGLQVARPRPAGKPRIYDYFAWHIPLPPNLLIPVTTGAIFHASSHLYRFENWFRTGQRKHKAFRSAVPIR